MANISGYIKSLVSSLATVATSGSYTDLTNKPTLATVATSGSYTDLTNKPTLGTAAALNVGTTANKIVQLDANSKLPAVDGSNLTNVIASSLSPSVPYSVISAKTDANGYASFINKVSNTEISFDTNSGSTPIKICYPDGSIETNNTLPNITGISVNGINYIVKEKGSNPYNTTLQPVESNTAPSSPATNQLWLDLSVVPAIPKKYNGSTWDITQFVKLGEFTRTAGVIGTPISYALNGRYSIQTSFNFPVNFAHNLGVSISNQQIMCYDALCITSTGTFTAGYSYPIYAAKDTGFTASVFTQKNRNQTRLSYHSFLTVLDDTGSVVALALGNTNFNLVFSIKRSF